MEFALDATFFAFVGLVLFLALVVYLKVPGMMAKSLDDRADQIRNELSEAKRLREEAQHLLAEYQRKRKEAEAEAAHIVAAAEREAEMLTARSQEEDGRIRRKPHRGFRAEDQAGGSRCDEGGSFRCCRSGHRRRRKRSRRRRPTPRSRPNSSRRAVGEVKTRLN